jgi:Uma2 family endonuclease
MFIEKNTSIDASEFNAQRLDSTARPVLDYIEIMLRSGRMATALHISIHEYLGSSYRPDREYVDGEIRERNVGKYEHARVQALLARWFGNHEQEWGVQVVTEQRLQVSQTRVRIPDVTLLTPGAQPDVIVDPPLLIVEILSPDDSYSDTQERAQDYRTMGVETVWIIDPKTRSGRMCSGAEWVESSRLEVKGTPFYVNLPEIFGQLTSA